MKKIIRLVCSLLLLSGFCQAEFCESFITVGAGYRVDSLNWNLGGFNNQPNVLSELKWDNLNIFEINTKGKYFSPWGLYLCGEFDYGWIVSGNNQDSDYHGNNRTQEYLRSNNHTDGDDVLDISLALGWPMDWPWLRGSFIPLIGGSYHQQNVNMVDGYLTINADDPLNVGPLPNLNSTYSTQWGGPWVGFDYLAKLYEPLTFYFGYEFHYAVYEGAGFWNLRLDFDGNFTHEAYGIGNVIKSSMYYDISSNAALGADLKFQAWSTFPGRDRTNFVQNGIVVEGQTRLNEVNWDSFSFALSLLCWF